MKNDDKKERLKRSIDIIKNYSEEPDVIDMLGKINTDMVNNDEAISEGLLMELSYIQGREDYADFSSNKNQHRRKKKINID